MIFLTDQYDEDFLSLMLVKSFGEGINGSEKRKEFGNKTKKEPIMNI